MVTPEATSMRKLAKPLSIIFFINEGLTPLREKCRLFFFVKKWVRRITTVRPEPITVAMAAPAIPILKLYTKT